jgi:hypothetical protein
MVEDFRKTNQCCKIFNYPLPNIESILEYLAGARYFASFDLLKGYNQFPCSEAAINAFVIVTTRGLFRFKRVPMGFTNSAPWFQFVMTDEILRDLVYKICLVYLDDVLIYARNADEFFQRLRRVLLRFRERKLKVHIGKTSLFVNEIIWCGRLFTSKGMQANPIMVKTLLNAELPTTARELQHFYHAMNWMRTTIPNFANIADPIHELLEAHYLIAKSRKAKRLAKIQLKGWNKLHVDAVNNLKTALLQSALKAYPRDDFDRNVLMDASNVGWSLLITQTPSCEKFIAIEERSHELLFCISGRFRNNQRNWHITSKEAYPLLRALRDAPHLLQNRSTPLHVYTDHRNLLAIFDPNTLDNPKKYTIERLLRWSIELQSVRYVIHHIAGESNTLADYFSRQSFTCSLAVPAKLARLSASSKLVAKLNEKAHEVFRKHRVQAH